MLLCLGLGWNKKIGFYFYWPPWRNDNQRIVGRSSQSRMNLFPEKTNRSLAGCDLGNFFLIRQESTEKFPEGHSLICLNGFVLKPVCPRGTLYNGLYRKFSFFMLQVRERVGISLVCERVGTSILVCKKAQKG